MPDPTPGEIQSRRAVRGHILFCVGIFLALYIAWQLSKELEIIYVSALFAVVLTPIVLRITKFEIRGYHPLPPSPSLSSSPPPSFALPSS